MSLVVVVLVVCVVRTISNGSAVVPRPRFSRVPGRGPTSLDAVCVEPPSHKYPPDTHLLPGHCHLHFQLRNQDRSRTYTYSLDVNTLYSRVHLRGFRTPVPSRTTTNLFITVPKLSSWNQHTSEEPRGLRTKGIPTRPCGGGKRTVRGNRRFVPDLSGVGGGDQSALGE